MNISLDYDDTFTKDPIAWSEFIDLMTASGHTVYGVTYRSSDQMADISPMYLKKCYKIFNTSFKSKRQYMKDQNIKIHIWIDDLPETIIHDVEDWI